MADVFGEMNQALLRVAQGLEKTTAGLKVATDAFIEASKGLSVATDGLTQTSKALVRTVELSIVARGEHEDVRETVHRLETMVLDLTRDVRALREQHGNGSHS